MRLRYTTAASRELDQILDYIERQSPDGARRVMLRIKQIEALISTFPESGRNVRFGLRQITTRPYPYIVFYEVVAEEVIVHRLRHGARKPLGKV